MITNAKALDVLRLLKMRADTAGQGGKSSAVDLNELVEHFGLPRLELRDLCLLLETDRFISGGHGAGPDDNPAYLIADWGRRYVVENA